MFLIGQTQLMIWGGSCRGGPDLAPATKMSPTTQQSISIASYFSAQFTKWLWSRGKVAKLSHHSKSKEFQSKTSSHSSTEPSQKWSLSLNHTKLRSIWHNGMIKALALNLSRPISKNWQAVNWTKERTFTSFNNICLNGTIKVLTMYKITKKLCHSNQAPQTSKPLRRTDRKKIFISYNRAYSKLKVKI